MAKAYKKRVQKVTVNRGDAVELNFTLPGDVTAEKIYFTVKPDRELTSARFIDKANLIGGGSDSQILATTKGNNTEITVFIVPEDTQDLSNGTTGVTKVSDDYLSLQYDVCTQTTGDPDGTLRSLVDGEFQILGDVRSPFDGFETPNEVTRFQQIDASDYNPFDMLQVTQDGEGNKSFIQLTVSELLTQLGLVNTAELLAIWRHTGLKSGTLIAPPPGLSVNEVWEDTTDSANQPILRISKITT